MAKTIDPTKLFIIDEKVQGWDKILDYNMKRLDALFLRLSAIVDINDILTIQDRDMLIWDAANSRWQVTRFYDIFPTTTTTTTTTVSTTTQTGETTASTTSSSSTSSSTQSTLSTTSSSSTTTTSTVTTQTAATTQSTTTSSSTSSSSTVTTQTGATTTTSSTTSSSSSSSSSSTTTTTTSSTTSSSSTATTAPGGESGSFYPAASGDDTQIGVDNEYFYGNLNWQTFGYGDDHYNSSFRFTNITIPPGATITSAVIKFHFYTVPRTVSRNINIKVNTVDDATAPTTHSEFDSLSLSSAVSWYINQSFSAGEHFQTPDISSLVQAIVDRGGWHSGHAMQFVLEDADTDHTSNDCAQARSYDSGSDYPELYVEWTE